ncbi:MAG: hypothetical protein J6D02_05625 [Lachnospira sp.]|nr:hypothetical protein [Lachnospira sp.]
MGKQLNYWMDYDSFVILAKKALELGFVIYRKADENGKLVFGTNIDVVTKDENDYFFYLPDAGEIVISVYNGREIVSRVGKGSNVIIEAGYSYVNEKHKVKQITRNRIYCTTGYYDNEGVFVERPEVLTKAYNSLARYTKKLAPYTELHDLRISLREDNYGQTFEYIHKEYLTAWCLQKREEGYKLQG